MKAIYANRAIQRGEKLGELKELLAENLYWIFQTESLDGIVKKGENPLSFNMKSDKEFSLGNGTVSKIKMWKVLSI